MLTSTAEKNFAKLIGPGGYGRDAKEIIVLDPSTRNAAAKIASLIADGKTSMLSLPDGDEQKISPILSSLQTATGILKNFSKGFNYLSINNFEKSIEQDLAKAFSLAGADTRTGNFQYLKADALATLERSEKVFKLRSGFVFFITLDRYRSFRIHTDFGNDSRKIRVIRPISVFGTLFAPADCIGIKNQGLSKTYKFKETPLHIGAGISFVRGDCPHSPPITADKRWVYTIDSTLAR